MNIILSILILLTSLTGQAPAPTVGVPMEQVEQTPIPQVLGLDWLTYELALTGQTVPENVIIALTNESNCGADLSTAGIGGCTHWLPSGVAYITVSPELAWSAWGNHILHHELGHVVLDSHDECAVESYAHQFETTPLWSYPECDA